jgi:lipoprotein-anchoring transpeptidase ErfK/SrfK
MAVAGALTFLGWLWWRGGNSHAPSRKAFAPEAKPPPSLRTNPPPAQPPRPQVVSGPLKTNAPPTQARTAPQPPPHPAVSATNAPPASPAGFPRPVQSVFEAQVALARQDISPGSIDGVLGRQTRQALRAFQQKAHLPVTGVLDDATRERLRLYRPACAPYTVRPEDLARLQPLSRTWLGKSQQTALDYETILELAAEKAQAHPGLVRRLNPAVDWKHVLPGTVLTLPDADDPQPPAARAAFIRIRLSQRVLEAFDTGGNLLAHFPCSIARLVQKRPIGELHVAVIVKNPSYTFDPALFPESAEGRRLGRKLVLPPGPNNPVGVVWIGLDKPGYGIHGTPGPEAVGRTESHGCFRLANWNAEHLLKLVWIGLPVYVEH